ncbi:hypothetical protein GCM10022255_095920 [Dactylosporangium darangshiense]|uniref:Uncharacterized protein n=1 Tax=Dactylosporangium darangshiense TaxID=579108 RepID=A0ABP8DQG7_9ACTN
MASQRVYAGPATGTVPVAAPGPPNAGWAGRDTGNGPLTGAGGYGAAAASGGKSNMRSIPAPLTSTGRSWCR